MVKMIPENKPMMMNSEKALDTVFLRLNRYANGIPAHPYRMNIRNSLPENKQREN